MAVDGVDPGRSFRDLQSGEAGPRSDRAVPRIVIFGERNPGCRARRWARTRDAHELYGKFGFTPLKRPEIFMEVQDPNVYRKP